MVICFFLMADGHLDAPCDQNRLMRNKTFFFFFFTPKLLARLVHHQEAQSAIFNMWGEDRRWRSARLTPVLFAETASSLCNVLGDQSDSLVWKRWREGQREQIRPRRALQIPPSKSDLQAVIWANDANENPLMSSCIVSVSALIPANPIFFFFLSNILDRCDGRSSFRWLANAISSWQQVLITLLRIKKKKKIVLQYLILHVLQSRKRY